MSRNFELLQQAGLSVPGGLPGRIEVPFGVTSRRETRERAKDRAHVASLHPADLSRAAREETLRLVQSVFLLQGETDNGRVVVFASVDPGSGCSHVCVQAAQILAESVPGSVCLVDANFREPTLPSAFAVMNHHGLSEALRSSEPIKAYAKVVQGENLWLISCGSGVDRTVGLLHSDRVKQRIEELRQQFDYVLIDAPPLNAYSEGVALGQFSDGLVLVLEANSTRRDASSRIAERLRAMQVNILGAVLNKRTYPIPDALYRRL
jgi:succinoglycan biosynthesis transport protein ExoP